MTEPGSQEWLDLVIEDVVDPDQRIIDPHHHLWPPGQGLPYGLDELHGDTSDGHRVEATVFVECGAAYDREAPGRLQSLGETVFVAEAASQSRAIDGQATIEGIVGSANMLLGDGLDDVLDAHIDAAGELFKGIRHSGAFDPEPDALMIPGRGPAGLYLDEEFRAGVTRLGERGLTFDTWHYHHQNAEFAQLAAAVPGTTMILDHFGTPLGVGRFAGKHDEIFETWQHDIAAIAANQNVVAKLGGLAMPDNGFGWHTADRPPSSDEFVAAQERWYLHTIECFGPERCMFESNFPVDRMSLSYRVMWNGLKKIAQAFSIDERDQMFYGTASRVYRI